MSTTRALIVRWISRIVALCLFWPVVANLVDLASAASDTTPPQILSLSASPTTIAAGEATTLTVRAIDAGSGIQSLYVGYQLVGGNANRSTSLIKVSGSVQDGVWQGFLSIPETAGAGTWVVSYVQAYDVAGNYRTVNPPDPPTNQGALTVTGGDTSSPPDTTPPQVVSLSTSPTTLTAGEATTLTVRAIDTGSGVQSLYVGYQVVGGNANRSMSLVRVSGSPLDGVWQGFLSLPETAGAGTWVVSYIQAYDVAGNYRTINPPDPPTDQGNLTVTGGGTTPPADTTPPQIASLSASPTTLAAGEATMLTIRATDAGSGVQSLYVGYQLIGGNANRSTSLLKMSGSGQDGIWQGFLSIPETAGTGTWVVSYIQAFDVAGNYRTVNSPDPPTNQGPLTVGDAIPVPPPQGTDFTAPMLSSLEISPSSLHAGEAVTLTVRATDDDSGVTSISGNLMAGQGPQSGYATFVRVSGTSRDAIWKAIVSIPDTAWTSTWTINNLTAYDAAGNYRSYSGAAIGTGSFAVTANGTPDTVAPQLSALDVSPASVHAGEAVTLSLRATDDSSGVISISGNLMAGDGPHSGYATFVRISGTARDATWKAIVPISDTARSSTWTINNLTAYDAAGNYRSFSGAAVGTPDVLAPQLSSLEVSPTSLHAGEAITLSLRAADDSSGVTSISGNLMAGEGPHSGYATFVRISGTARDATWKAIVPIPETAWTSTWTVNNLTVYDAAGNYRSYSGAAIGTGSFSVTAGAPDTPTPTLTVTQTATSTVTPTQTGGSPTPTATLAGVGTGQTPTPTPTSGPVATRCNPRPPVQLLTSRVGEGRLAVTVRASTNPATSSNQLYLIRLDKFDNASAETPMGRVENPTTIPLQTGAQGFSFTLVRGSRQNDAAMVHLTAIDACGEWPTFVGGGAGAF